MKNGFDQCGRASPLGAIIQGSQTPYESREQKVGIRLNIAWRKKNVQHVIHRDRDRFRSPNPPQQSRQFVHTLKVSKMNVRERPNTQYSCHALLIPFIECHAKSL